MNAHKTKIDKVLDSLIEIGVAGGKTERLKKLEVNPENQPSQYTEHVDKTCRLTGHVNKSEVLLTALQVNTNQVLK